MVLPEIKEQVEAIENEELKNICKFQYETACRISEAVGKYAIMKEDFSRGEYKGHQLAFFTLKTAKRGGIPRIIALPIKLDSWVQDLVTMFEGRQGRVFGYARSTVEHLLEAEFKTLTYSIDKYRVPTDERNKEGKRIWKIVQTHENVANSHSLRHFRLTELVNSYGFDDVDTAIFAGWTMKNTGVSPMFSKYVTGQWGRYIDKLLT